MILDNETRNVHDWIEKHTKEGKINIVTGYFTIGALTWLARVANQKIKHFNFVLGEIVNQDSMRDRSINLLNENISLESAFQLHAIARQAVAFLEKKEVITKTLEPNFCHAKTFIFESENDQDDHYFIQGSSNLTEAGIGLRKTSNIELNLAHRGKSGNFKELDEWFEKIWNSPRAHTQKTIRDASGKTRKVDFKKYLIEQISKIFEAYTPENIYFKILFELFSQDVLPDQLDQNFQKQIGRLENTAIFKVLFEFQQKGVLSLIGMLKKHDGAVLADAVGLGKTWSALAVIKFFEMNGRETVLLCPKKLQHNWRQYQKNQNSKFETDKFEYFIRFHTDLQDTRFEKYTDRSDHYFQNDKPLLLVIDESHNLRNHKSGRYKYLINEILKHKADVKVLLISATPINNSLADIRNQYKLLVKGRNDGFSESLGIKNLDYSFRSAEKVFKNWSLSPAPKVADFIKNLPPNFFRLTDALTVARTRPMIEGMQNGLHFPKKSDQKTYSLPQKIWVILKHLKSFSMAFRPCFRPINPLFMSMTNLIRCWMTKNNATVFWSK